MKRLLGVSACGALLMTAWLGAAPSPSSVADAAMKGDRDAVRALLKQGADVSAAKGDGMTALHFAAERGDAAMTEMLVYAGANVSAVTRIGQYTPLHLASRAGNAAVVQALLKAGANVSARTTTSGVTPLHLAAVVRQRARWSPCCSTMAPTPTRGESEWGQTPLMFAAAENRVDAIRVLLERGADATIKTKTHRHRQPVGARSRGQRSPEEGARGVGAEGAAADAAPGAGGDRGVARAVLRQARFRRPRRSRRPAAAGAAAAPDDANAANSFNPEEINPPVSNKGGMTALLHAARQGHLEAVRALLDEGAPIDQVGSGDATSPLLMSVINGEFDLAMFLIERGANPNLAAGGNGATPLWAAVNTQWQPRTRYPQPQEMEQQKTTYLDVMKALLDKGADPDARLKTASLVPGLQRLRQPQLRSRRHRGIDRLLARGVRDRSRGDEAA